MSAFVCILDRSGAGLAPGELRRLAEVLDGQGTEVATFHRGPVGMAISHQGGDGVLRRTGPLVDSVTGQATAVAGRFVSLGDDLQSVGTEPGGKLLECAALAQGRAGADDFLSRLSGSFVLLAADPVRGSITLVRDHLGDLRIHYFLDGSRLIAASDPAAILRHPAVSDDLDETSIARFLGFRFGHTERSYFGKIREVPPAHRLRVTADGSRLEQYWRLRRLPSAANGSAEEIVEEFRRRLRHAVAADFAGLEPERVGLSLSGGLDSTAIAAVAPEGVRAFSWTFEETPEGDERANIEAVSRHLELPVRWVRGDGFYPLSGDFAERFVHEGSPYLNAFAALKHRLYEVAREQGCERMLVGDGGDTLYAAREYWLRDALATGEPWALQSLAKTVRRAARGDRFARLALIRLFPVRGLRSALRPPPWLTPTAREALPKPARSPILPVGRGAARFELAVGVKHSELESEERRLFAQCGIERGNPFWSWPLLEMAIQLPATWYHRDGVSKILTREALRGLLPAEILESPRIGLLGSFFLRGIEERREDLKEMVFRHPRSDWRRYVRREWLEPYLEETRKIAFGHTILWRVISYELWIRRLIRGS